MKKTLKLWDYVLLILSHVLSVCVGLYYRFTGGKQKTTKEYFLGNADMNVLTVALSLMVSLLSAITLIGVTSEIYLYGAKFVFINIGFLLGTPIMAYLFVPVFFKESSISLYEYLGRRFGRTLRTSVSLIYVLQTTLYLGVALYTPSLALSTVSEVTVETAVIVVGAVCTIYSAMGGIKGVLVTDAIQWPITTILNIVVVLCGLVIYAYYAYCDPMLQGSIEKPDQLLPFFVMETMGDIPGLVGLFFSGLFSAGLSTVSSGLNSVAAIIYNDFLLGALSGMAICFGFCSWIAFMGATVREPELSRTTSGCNASFTFRNATILAANPVTSYLYSISSMWLSTIGVVITVVIGLLGSLLMRKSSAPVDSELLSPLNSWIRQKMLNSR